MEGILELNFNTNGQLCWSKLTSTELSILLWYYYKYFILWLGSFFQHKKHDSRDRLRFSQNWKENYIVNNTGIKNDSI